MEHAPVLFLALCLFLYISESSSRNKSDTEQISEYTVIQTATSRVCIRNGQGDEVGIPKGSRDLQPEFLLHVPHREESLP